jgi:hypothetical protein
MVEQPFVGPCPLFQFLVSSSLQPKIRQYASELLPVLISYLPSVYSHLQESRNEPLGLNNLFYALEMLCKNLGNELVPYLSTLMNTFFTALNPKNPVHLQEVVLSCIRATGWH